MVRRRDQQLLDEVGRRIQRLRSARDMTQRQLAEAIGVEPESISRAETGAISLSLSNLSKVAEALSVTVADVVDCARPQPPPPAPATDEQELLATYCRLDANGRRAALGAVRGIAQALQG
jgi:transcriptional regulator with XRE-family HTH domain